MDQITPERLTAALRSGGEFLDSTIVSEGNNRGFPEIAGARRIRPWGGTADGLLGLHFSGHLSRPNLKGLASWLYDSQILIPEAGRVAAYLWSMPPRRF